MEPVKVVLFSSTRRRSWKMPALPHILSKKKCRGALSIVARTNMDIFDSKMAERFVNDYVSQADLMIMIFHGGRASCTYFDDLVESG